jgi:predicted helicase
MAFVSNSSFINSRTYDGFRRTVSAEFGEIYVLDLGGDVRADPRLSGTKHNVFGIQTGVAISFMVKRAKAKGCHIRYARRPQLETAEEKLAFLGNAKFDSITFEDVAPDARCDWINQAVGDFDAFIKIADKKTKVASVTGQEQAIFKRFTLGVVTNRDDWVYGIDSADVESKVRYLIEVYDRGLKQSVRSGTDRERVEEVLDYSIKWTRLVKALLKKRIRISFDGSCIIPCSYRPYSKEWLYYSKQVNEMQYRLDEFYGDAGLRKVPTIIWSDPTSQKPFMCAAVSGVYDLHFVGAASGAVGAAASIISRDGRTADNITDWACDQFRAHYAGGGKTVGRSITKDTIFHFVYGVLHDPTYREKYAQNLKREFPRIPFYPDFWRWADWGEKLMALHIGYETVKPWPLERIDAPANKVGLAPKAVLRADKEAGNIQLDTETQLAGVPSEAWRYKLGNRAALEWILDQHKERTPKDLTIREKFNTYRFESHKEKVIDLLKRVTRVSVETMTIVEAMRAEKEKVLRIRQRKKKRAPRHARLGGVDITGIRLHHDGGDQVAPVNPPLISASTSSSDTPRRLSIS